MSGSTSTDGPDPDPSAARPKSPEEIAAVYADVADRLDRWGWVDRLVTGRYRRRQFGDARGRVLDVACGTGTNFPYLLPSVDLVGVDISPEMLERARSTLESAPPDGTVRRMDAADLKFADDSFDAVISALSTCTFPEPVAALREMRRVCRPDGRILLLEHGRSDLRPVARFLDWRAPAHYEQTGCRWNQEPLHLVREAGVPVVAADRFLGGLVTGIEAAPDRER